MTIMESQEKTQERTLNALDRCDAANCGAAALVKIVGVSGELLFCGHHYSKYENSANLKNFAFNIIDERWTLQNENRLKED